METYTKNEIVINAVRLAFRNFAGRRKTVIKNGRETIVNDEGNRNFTVNLDTENSEIYLNNQLVEDPSVLAEILQEAFHKISFKPGLEEGDPGQYRLQCNFSYIDDYVKRGKPVKKQSDPEFYLVVGNRKPVLLDAETVNELDFDDIIGGTVWLNDQRPYPLNDGSMRNKFWCNKAYFVIREDRFEQQYNNYDAE